MPFALLLPDMLVSLGQKIFYPNPTDKLMVRLSKEGKSIKIGHINESRSNIVVRNELGEIRDESCS